MRVSSSLLAIILVGGAPQSANPREPTREEAIQAIMELASEGAPPHRVTGVMVEG
ncbi:hypothetical protein ACFL5A_04025 [Gemmatimonadota bacterium]